MSLAQVEIRKLFLGNINVRRTAGNITELTQSVKEKGIEQPLLVRPVKGKYEIVAGRRRFHAARAAGLKKVPVIIRQLRDDEAIVASLIENLQREDIDPEEEYDGYVRLQKLNAELYGSYEQLHKATSKSKTHIEDVFSAVEFARGLRGTKKMVKIAPTREEKEKGAISLVHAKLLKTAERAETVKELPKGERLAKLSELTEAVVDQPVDKARKIIDEFKKDPEKPVERIKETALAKESGVHLHIYIAPKVASVLSKAAEDRGMTEEELIPVAVEEWLKQVGYSI